jgi:tyrosyl-tRNA synthetase
MKQGAKPTPEMPEHKFKPVDEQLAYIKKGVAEIIPENELVAKLENSRKTGKPLRVYLGVDPTAPDLHLGHTVVLRKLKHFQDLGHTAVFLIGDFSAMIGDPTGVSETRPPLTREQVDANAKTYLEQVYKILDRQKTEVRYNSEWLGKLTSYEIIRLTAKYSLPRMLERDDFKQRLSGELKARIFRSSEETPGSRETEEAAFKLPSSGKPSPVKRPPSMAIHELLYPLLTALDAVELQSDVELGATEQKFNLLVHREIQREYGLPGQAILTMPILVGLDGQRKMSKSLGNYVGITEPPNEMFGKLMSIPDDLMWPYYELLTDRAPKEIAALQKEVSSGKLHPMDAKMRLAQEVINDFHGQDAAHKAADNFQRVFRDRQAPEEAPVKRLARGVPTRVSSLVFICEFAPSRSEAERLIKQKAVEIDGVVVDDPRKEIDLSKPANFLLRAGKKKFARIIIE